MTNDHIALEHGGRGQHHGTGDDIGGYTTTSIMAGIPVKAADFGDEFWAMAAILMMLSLVSIGRRKAR